MSSVTRITLLAALSAGVAMAAASPAKAIPVTYDFGFLGPNGRANPVPSGLTLYAPNNTALTYTNSAPGTGSADIVASGFNSPGDPWQLTQRGFGSGGLDEDGLGLQSFPDSTPTEREIGPQEVVLLDYSDIIAKGGSVASLFFGSIQAHGSSGCEGFEVFASNTAPTGFSSALGGAFVAQSGTGGNACGPTSLAVSLTGALAGFADFKYFSVTALQINNPNGTHVFAPDNDVTIGTTVVDLPSAVPEPAGFALVGVGLIGLAAVRRRG